MGKKHKYDKEWIQEHIVEENNATKLCKLYNEAHGTSVSLTNFRHYVVASMKLRFHGTRSKFSVAEREFIKEFYQDTSIEEFMEMFESKFGWKPSRFVVTSFAQHKGLNKSKEAVSRSAYETINKRAAVVGEEREDYNGYFKVKVQGSVNVPTIWKRKHVYIWEQANGEVPEGHVIMFKDGNPNNFDLENLVCVPSSYCGYVAALGGHRNSDPRLNELKFDWYALKDEISKREKGENEQHHGCVR